VPSLQRTRQSAGMPSPPLSAMTSPCTSSRTGSWAQAPPRFATACGAAISCGAVSDEMACQAIWQGVRPVRPALQCSRGALDCRQEHASPDRVLPDSLQVNGFN
jgi:hypothetical protein